MIINSIVIYYTLLGHNKGIAEEIAKENNSKIVEFAPGRISRVFQFFWGKKKLRKKANKVDISGYDEVIICGPIWAGKPAAAIKALLEALDLKGKSVKTYFTFTQDHGETEDAIKKRMKGKGANLVEIQFKNISKKAQNP